MKHMTYNFNFVMQVFYLSWVYQSHIDYMPKYYKDLYTSCEVRYCVVFIILLIVFLLIAFNMLMLTLFALLIYKMLFW